MARIQDMGGGGGREHQGSDSREPWLGHWVVEASEVETTFLVASGPSCKMRCMSATGLGSHLGRSTGICLYHLNMHSLHFVGSRVIQLDTNNCAWNRAHLQQVAWVAPTRRDLGAKK